MNDSWASGESYQHYVGRWSRLVATEFIRWLGLPSGKEWLDVGCGTGALSNTILERSSPSRVQGIDPSESHVQYAREKTNDPRAAFVVGMLEKAGFPADSFDSVVSGLVVNFIPDPAAAVAEMKRITRPGGTIAAYVWDYAGKMEFMRYFWNAVVALDPAASDLDEGKRFPLCSPDPLHNLFASAGLHDIRTHSLDVPTRFKNFDDLWGPFLGGQGPAPTYTMSLSEEKRAALRERLRTSLPVQNDGSIDLIARAWAVRGQKA